MWLDQALVIFTAMVTGSLLLGQEELVRAMTCSRSLSLNWRPFRTAPCTRRVLDNGVEAQLVPKLLRTFSNATRCPEARLRRHPICRIPDCALNPCLNGAICEETLDHYICHCSAEFDGKNCKTRRQFTEITTLNTGVSTPPAESGTTPQSEMTPVQSTSYATEKSAASTNSHELTSKLYPILTLPTTVTASPSLTTASTTTNSGPELFCEETWTKFGEKCYKVSAGGSPGTKYWHITQCGTDYANIAEVTSSELNMFIAEVLLPAVIGTGDLTDVFVDCTGAGAKGKWNCPHSGAVWTPNGEVDGTNVGYWNWYVAQEGVDFVTQPDSTTGMIECLRILRGSGFNYKWADTPCESSYPSVCQVQAQPKY